MDVFKLEDAIEYRQIKEYRRILVVAVNKTVTNFIPAICSSVATIAKLNIENASSGGVLMDPADDKELSVKRNAIIAMTVRRETLDSLIAEFNSELPKNIYKIFPFSNYAFAEYVFWAECDFNELKKYRVGTPFDDQTTKLARHLRKKGEDLYKNGLYDEAIRSFHDSELKNEYDITVLYQLALIYFFEKADYANAMEYFGKAARYSREKSTQIFIHSNVFIGLLLRIMVRSTGNHDLLNEAYQAVNIASNADSSYSFSKYALAQCHSAMSSMSSSASSDAVSIINDLIQKDKMFALQLVFDRAFDRFLPEIEGIISKLLSKAVNNAADVLKTLQDSLDNIANFSQYSSVPAKYSAARNDFIKLSDQFNHKNFFDISTVLSEAKSLLTNLQEIIKEVNKNKAYFEIKAVVEKYTAKFNEEMSEANRPFTKVEDQYNRVKDQIQEMNRIYPTPEAAGADQGSDEGGGRPSGPRKGWREARLFFMIKILAGCFSFLIVFFAIVAYFLISGLGITMVTMALCFINLLCSPIYATIGGEIFYSLTENKRTGLRGTLNRLRILVKNNKEKSAEIEKKIRDKYVKHLVEEIKVSTFVAEQMIDIGVRGTFEKLKTLIP